MMKISTKSQSHRAYGFKEILFNYFFSTFYAFWFPRPTMKISSGIKLYD